MDKPKRTYALELVVVGAERLIDACTKAMKEPQPPWTIHLLATLKTELNHLKNTLGGEEYDERDCKETD